MTVCKYNLIKKDKRLKNFTRKNFKILKKNANKKSKYFKMKIGSREKRKWMDVRINARHVSGLLYQAYLFPSLSCYRFTFI